MSNMPIVDYDLDSEELSSERYERSLPAIMAVPTKEVKPFSLSVLSAEIAVLGRLPAFHALWPEAVRALPLTDPTLIDKLEDYAVAAVYAYRLLTTSVKDSDGLDALYEEAVAIRGILRAELDVLIVEALIKRDTTKKYSGQTGHKIVAYDLQTLTTVLRRHWSRVQGKCGVVFSDIEHADLLATRLLVRASERDHAPKTLTVEQDIRARAMTLFVNCYDDVRRCVCFLRWKQGDADTIAPSLYAGRKPQPQGRPRPAISP